MNNEVSILVYDRLQNLKPVIGDLSIALLNDKTNEITDKQLREILTFLRQYRDLLEGIIKSA